MAEINAPDAIGSRPRTTVVVLIMTGFLLSVVSILLLIRSHVSPSPRPPDLRDCTRIEFVYQQSVMEYFDTLAAHSGLLDSRERQFLQSLEQVTVHDSTIIRSLANNVRSGQYSRTGGGMTRKKHPVKVNCYSNDKRVASFTLYDSVFIVTDEGRRFDYDGFPEISSFAPQLNPFVVRMCCARMLIAIGQRLGVGSDHKMEYPRPDTWCDQFVGIPRVRSSRLRRSMMNQADGYRCIGAGEGRCHYAMNPNCRPDSPPDMVLVFEANAGWNQHGGPELFTFEHHNPRGGCILLNDGTVKFIRTEEELKQLRWK